MILIRPIVPHFSASVWFTATGNPSPGVGVDMGGVLYLLHLYINKQTVLRKIFFCCFLEIKLQ
jgi:hypothetical protein